MSDDFRLLITGSRKATDDMAFYAHRAVGRAIANGWQILVGDAFGVDKAVAVACFHFGAEFDCFGITEKPRFGSWFSDGIVRNGLMTYHRVKGDYLARDRHMANLCNRVLAIWNGTSRGTKYTYDFVRNLGKPGDLIKFNH